MNIRPATSSDAEAIAALVASFQPELTDDPAGLGAENYLLSVSADAERTYLENERYQYFVSESAGELLGFIAMRDQSHLFHLFVTRSHQGRGIARALWHRAREGAVARGYAGPFTVNSSARAVPVYEAFGFTAIGPLTRLHGISFLPMRLEPS